MKIFKEVVQHWKNDWQTNRTMFWFELFGTLFSVVSTTLMSFFANVPPMVLCYSLWLIGSTLIMIGAFMRKASWIFVFMAFNTILNIVGLWVLLLK